MSRRKPKVSKIIRIKHGIGRYAIVNKETGVVIGYEYVREPTHEELSHDIDSLVLDDNGCINGFDVGGMKENPDFIDLLLDDRYSGPYD